MSKKKYIVLLCLMALLSSNYYSTLNTINDKNTLFQKDFSLKSSGYWVLNSTIIDNTGGGDYTWSEAETEDWCSGSGSLIDPFVIENVTIDAKNVGSALSIRNSNVYFRIENCTLFNATNAGIELINVTNSEIIKNDCSNNGFGISLEPSSFNNEISSNFINNNSQFGIILDRAENNLIFNNTLWNTINAFDNGTNNDWDDGAIGNYWSDYEGLDKNNDDIGENPYIIIGGSQDNFPLVDRYILPSVNEYIPLEQTIKVGIVGDLNKYSGLDNWRGAYLAATEINKAGGILINSSTYYIGLKSVNTYEHELQINISKALNAVNKLISEYNPQFIIGGYRNETFNAYLEPIMDNEIPLMIVGAAGDPFTQKVLDDYERYKYLFRVTPMNGSALVTDWIWFDISLKYSLDSLLSRNIYKIAYLYEDPLEGYIEALKTFLPSFGFEMVKEIKVNYDDTLDDFINYWEEIDNAGAQFTSFGFLDKSFLMSQAYGYVKPRCLISGINIYGANSSYWDTTSGNCNYEIDYQAAFNVGPTPRSIPFWNNFISNYSYDPSYIAGGAYSAVGLINYSILDTQSFDSSKIVLSLEKI
ncbi:MAG: NosD domain-containing protein, partial [Candidatus Thorarchaeota archaeon]